MGSYVKENPDMAQFFKLMLEEFTVTGVSIWRVKNEHNKDIPDNPIILNSIFN